MPTALVIIAPALYQDVELAGTLRGLQEAGIHGTVASTRRGTCTGKFGGKTTATLALREVELEAFDRITFIGGPGAEALCGNPDALRIAREAVATGKPLGAICIAPTILAAAGVLRGKKATVWDQDGAQARVLREAGAEYTGEAVTTDGMLITANGPSAAEAFGRGLASL